MNSEILLMSVNTVIGCVNIKLFLTKLQNIMTCTTCSFVNLLNLFLDKDTTENRRIDSMSGTKSKTARWDIL